MKNPNVRRMLLRSATFAALAFAGCDAETVSEIPVDRVSESQSTLRAPAEAPAAHRIANAPDLARLYLEEVEIGDRQSPINILTRRVHERDHHVRMHYERHDELVRPTGHTIQVGELGGGDLDLDGDDFAFVQMHFHTPSEHLIDGITFPLEAHLVHQREAEDGSIELAVVAVLFREGDENPVLRAVLGAAERATTAHPSHATVDVAELFRPDGLDGDEGEPHGYFAYDGSLTTPPFSENVRWLVMENLHEASPEQIQELQRMEGNNARHIQGVHRRTVDHLGSSEESATSPHG